MFFYGPFHMDAPVLAGQQRLCAASECGLEDLSGAIDNRESQWTPCY